MPAIERKKVYAPLTDGLNDKLNAAFLNEREAAELLGIPEDIMQVALLPVAYTIGTDFKRAKRPPVSNITHWDQW